MDVAARLAWTSAASRRATGKPDAVGIRAPPPDIVAGDPACRAPAGRLEAEIRRPSPFDKIADAASGLAEARPLFSVAKRLRLPRGCPRQRHGQATGHAVSPPSR